MRVYLYPTAGIDRHIVRWDCTEILVAFPVELHDDLPTAARRLRDLLPESASARLWAEYGAASFEEFVEVLTSRPCRVCTVPAALRLPDLPWPPCPEHGYDGAEVRTGLDLSIPVQRDTVSRG